jgi:phytoene dehydrogenase-like protein
MSESHDAIIVGGGHNGLVCGAYLAKAGLDVLVLERRHLVGGAVVTEELWPGYKVSVASYVMALLQPRVILDLELAKFGFEVIKPPPMFQPFPDGRCLIFWDDLTKTCEEIAKFSRKDAAAYPAYREHMRAVAAVARRFLWEIPPDPASRRLADVLDLLKFAWRFRDVREQFYALYDTMTLSAYDLLGRWFECDEIKAALGFYASGAGANSGIKTPGSAYVLLRPYIRDHETAAGTWGFVRGGMGAISEAIAAAGRRHGMKVRTDAEVARIVVRNGLAAGVVLRSGEEIVGRAVVANAGAKTTFLRLVPAEALDPTFIDDVRHIRDESTVFKVHLAVDKLPTYAAFDARYAGFPHPAQVRIGPSVDYIEQAYDESKYGRFSRRLLLSVMTPSLVDDTLAPRGRHVVSIMGAQAPYRLRDRSWDDARDELFDNTMDTWRQFAPDADDGILHKQLLTPVDFERIFDLSGGHVHHGELSADQIFFRRPVARYANYRTPVRNMYLCGASAHPGGGVTGVPGHNAAQVLLRDLGRQKRRK